MTALIIPFRFGDDPLRDVALQHVRRHYLEAHPGFRLTIGTCRFDTQWSKGDAVRRAFERTRADTLVVADADVLVDRDVLEDCVLEVNRGAPWAMPHDTVFRLGRHATLSIYGGAWMPFGPLAPNALERRAHRAPPGGGIVVLSRDAFETSGGIDPRFVGWGGDDISWARALDTLVGGRVQHDAPMYHLFHERALRRPGNRASPDNEALAARYMVAEGNVASMRALVDEHWLCDDRSVSRSA